MLKSWMNKMLTLLCCGLLLINTSSFGQVEICEGELSLHPVDRKLFEIKDSLTSAGIDSVILYGHWLAMNGFNGYGKVIWLDNGKVNQVKVILEKETGQYVLKLKTTQISDALFKFFEEKQMDTISVNPSNSRFSISHDSRHMVEVSLKGKKYCYMIRGEVVQFNLDNLRVKFITMLCDEDYSPLRIDGVKVRSE